MVDSVENDPDETAVVWGLGELGGLFAHGLLRCGLNVVPVRREDDARALAQTTPAPAVVLVAVGEADLDAVLDEMPSPWRGRVALVQNGLTPADWREKVDDPTVAVVWFEKKRGKPLRVLTDTRVAGPRSTLLVRALVELHIGAHPIRRSDLVRELATKNLWVETLNIGGLMTQPNLPHEVTSGDLLGPGHKRVAALARELVEVQSKVLSVPLDTDEVVRRVFDVFEEHPTQHAIGRSARNRLARAVQAAREQGVSAPVLAGMAETSEVQLPEA